MSMAKDSNTKFISLEEMKRQYEKLKDILLAR